MFIFFLSSDIYPARSIHSPIVASPRFSAPSSPYPVLSTSHSTGEILIHQFPRLDNRSRSDRGEREGFARAARGNYVPRRRTLIRRDEIINLRHLDHPQESSSGPASATAWIYASSCVRAYSEHTASPRERVSRRNSNWRLCPRLSWLSRVAI